MPKYESNNPKRRIAKPGFFTERELDGLASVAHYEGSAHHKTRPANYGFSPPVAPRHSKSLCDGMYKQVKAEWSRRNAAD